MISLIISIIAGLVYVLFDSRISELGKWICLIAFAFWLFGK